MRCPKCGFISFDHVDACLRCNKEISKSSSELEGTTYNVAPPSFLKFKKRTDRPEDDLSFGIDQDENDVVDPDLDVLVENEGDVDFDDDSGISFGDELDGFDSVDEEENFEIAIDDEDDEGIDLGQFEDAFEEEEPSGDDEGFKMEMPDELADISDLSPPAGGRTEKSREEPAAPAGGDDFDDDFNIDLELDNFDDDFKLTSDEDEDKTEDAGLGDLSLDDLGLAESEEEPPKPKKKDKRADMDMDADLDFNLDLGGLSLDDD